ncbi:M23 family metallopeptidase [Paenibacillus sp. LHD-117]|uniref:M23 family metallopeptidase n=1 Tax=Paenibacillus sp. LHD-117 TaxID=3071412 RepID=UPI0027E09EF7|nr:M23 family metallopeptidase [Paenibacillus sp. LHD-117]MDQ6418623.1 M23 family metallopeptidase [Paenibacillus sp. LHD-117]
MGLRDDVKHRRHEKIKTLLEEFAAKQEAGRIKEAREDAHLVFPVAQSDRVMREERNEPPGDYSPDPELAWKRNPNPWSAWSEESREGNMPRSFVRQTRTYEDSVLPPRSGWTRFRKDLQWKAVVALLLFGGVYGMFQYHADWSQKGQQLVKQALTDEFDFAAAAVWYKEVFAGAPSFIPMFQGDPSDALGVDGGVKGTVVVPIQEASLIRTFAELLNGVELAGASEAPVAAAETGRVIVVTKERDSVLIQHANNRVTVYGKLGGATVSVNDWVEAGDPIGKLQKAADGGQSLLYFAVKQDDRYMDPLDVITID